MTTPDYTNYSEPVGEDKLSQLSDLAKQQVTLEHELLQAEAAVDKAKERIRIISEVSIPLLMEEVGMSEFSTKDGIKVRVAEDIRASIPKARQGEAVVWLDQHGFAGLVKRKFTILFGKDEESWANKFEADLRKRKRELNVGRDATVHPQTLKAWVKEQLECGTDLPLDLFGVFRQRVAKVEVKG